MLMLNFKKFMEQNTVGKHNDNATGGIVSSDLPVLDTQKIPSLIVSKEMLLPSVRKTGKIVFLDRNSKQHSKLITVLLSDQTKLYFTWDEFKAIKGLEPEVGKSLTVVFQRHAKDKSDEPSQIDSVLCH